MTRKHLIVSLIIIAFCLAIWTFYIEPDSLVIRKINLHIPQWPENFRVKIALLSDLHIGMPYMREKKLKLIVQKVNSLKPDLIIFLGDFDSYTIVKSGINTNNIISSFKSLKAPYGVYSILGNHDGKYKEYNLKDLRYAPILGIHREAYTPDLIKNILRKSDISLLEDTYKEIKVDNSSLWLIGFSDRHFSKSKIKQMLTRIPENDPKILLNHRPDVFKKVPDSIPLMLSGHTHGGQVNFPIIGPLHSNSKYGYSKGLYDEDKKHLFVTSGLGNISFPIRFRNPPEIILLTIQ